MNDPLVDDLCNQFKDGLSDLIGTALMDRLPPFRLASMLLQASVVIAAGFELNPDDLLADLSEFAVEMNNDHYRNHLH